MLQLHVKVPPDRTMDHPYLSLVVPVFNADARLSSTLAAIDEFRRTAPLPLEVVFVDDCSTDGETLPTLRRYAKSRRDVVVLHNPVNRGKGYSVSRGMLAATGDYRVFTDVDLAYPLSEALKILTALEKGDDVAIACRVLPESRYLMSPTFFHYLYTRHLMSRGFNLMVRLVLLPGILDTQAGLKGFTAQAARRVFTQTTIPGFGFDIEVLYLARRLGLRMTQVAVDFRYDEEPTTVRLVRDSMRMLRDIGRVRWLAWTGRYRVTASSLGGPAATPASGMVGPMQDARPDAVAKVS